MQIPSQKSIIISKNSLHYPAERVNWEIPHGAVRSLSEAETSTNFKAEPPNYCHGNFNLNCEGMTEDPSKQPSGLRCPSLKVLLKDFELEIQAPDQTHLLLLELADGAATYRAQAAF